MSLLFFLPNSIIEKVDKMCLLPLLPFVAHWNSTIAWANVMVVLWKVETLDIVYSKFWIGVGACTFPFLFILCYSGICPVSTTICPYLVLRHYTTALYRSVFFFLFNTPSLITLLIIPRFTCIDAALYRFTYIYKTTKSVMMRTF